ncbi:UNVERIFIED_ORG: hypothetical protein J2W16_001211 [Pseudomonas cremoricolorata]|nr:hypothetical protein [Pseudomonas cremoricolorata]
MTVIDSMVPAAGVYSFDEVFAELTGMQGVSADAKLTRLG